MGFVIGISIDQNLPFAGLHQAIHHLYKGRFSAAIVACNRQTIAQFEFKIDVPEQPLVLVAFADIVYLKLQGVQT